MPTAPLSGRTCLVTGATSGIGLETAVGLARLGARVAIVGRSRERGERARAEIARRSGRSDVHLHLADLSSQQEIRWLAAEVAETHPDLSVLVNNAGVVNLRRQVTVEGIESMLAVNHLAYFLLTLRLLGVLQRNAPARVVIVASEAHRFGRIALDDLQAERRYRAMRRYGETKLANILFTYELARRTEGTGVTANCLHPGAVATRLGAQNGILARALTRALRPFFLSPARGAETSIHLAASDAVADVSGGYFVKRRERRSSDASYDRALAAELWQVSCALTGLEGPERLDAHAGRA